MRTILLTISYDGTDFCGWQKQKPSKTGSVRTVQEELEKALEIIHKEPVVASGSGRTDSGVHASFQAVTFISPIDSIPVEKYIPAINSLLPHDIRVMTAEIKPDGFHARYNATSRSYRYFMWIGETPPAREMRYIWPLFRKPNLETLNKMASYLKGEIDCTTFSAAGDKSVSKFRYLEKAHFFLDGEKLVFEIEANAFLWKMVRSLTGTLIHFEKMGYSPEYFKEVLDSKDRKLAGPTAPATGLFLHEVKFDGIRRAP